MSPKLRMYLLFLAFTFVRLSLFAQGRPDGPPPPDTRMPPSFPGLAVPIDQNIIVMIVLATVFGIYALLKMRKGSASLD